MSRTYLLFKHVLEIPKDCRKQCPLDKTFSHSQVEKDTSIWMWFEFQNNTFSLHIHSKMSWLFKKTLEWDCWFEFSYLHLAKILKSDEILDCPCIKLLLIRYSLKCLLTSSDCPNVLKVNWSKIEIASHNACHQIWKKKKALLERSLSAVTVTDCVIKRREKLTSIKDDKVQIKI